MNALLAYLPLLSPAVNGWASKQLGWSKMPVALIQPVFVNKLMGHDTKRLLQEEVSCHRIPAILVMPRPLWLHAAAGGQPGCYLPNRAGMVSVIAGT